MIFRRKPSWDRGLLLEWAIRGASALVCLMSALSLAKVKYSFFVALFAFDAPGSIYNPIAWIFFFLLLALPLLAVISCLMALANVFSASRRQLGIAIALGAAPVIVSAVIGGLLPHKSSPA